MNVGERFQYKALPYFTDSRSGTACKNVVIVRLTVVINCFYCSFSQMSLLNATATCDEFFRKFSELENRFDSMIFDAENFNSGGTVDIPLNILSTLSVISDNLQKCQKVADRMPSEFDKYSKKIGEDTLYEKALSAAYKSLRDFQTTLCAAYEAYFDINKKVHDISSRDDYKTIFSEFEEKMEELNLLCDSIESLFVNGRVFLDGASSNNSNEDQNFIREWHQIESVIESKLDELEGNLNECGKKLEFCKHGFKIAEQSVDTIIYLTQRLQAEEIRLRRLSSRTEERLQRLSFFDKPNGSNSGSGFAHSVDFQSTDSMLSSKASKSSSTQDTQAASVFGFSSEGSAGVDGLSKVKVWRAKAETVDTTSTELPEGWREIVDKTSSRTFYVNRITKEKQWRRPSSVQSVTSTITTKSRDFTTSTRSQTLSESTTRDGISKTSTVREMAPPSSSAFQKMPSKSGQNGLVSSISDDTGFKSGQSKESQSSKLVKKIEKARKATSQTLAQVEERAMSAAGHQGKVSVAYFDKIGRQEKRGYIQKQTKLLQRWKKRFVVLRENMLLYFDSDEEYNKWVAAGGDMQKRVVAGKAMQLTDMVSVAYTSIPNCFCLTFPDPLVAAAAEDRNRPDIDWFFLSENERDLEAWVTAINAHMHVEYRRSRGIRGDFWEDPSALVYTSFWRMPTAGADDGSSANFTLKQPLGIRTVPAVNAPRTGEGVFPGEVVETMQTISEAESGQVFLRLAYDRGWVMTRHPSGKYAVLCEVRGSFSEERAIYTFSPTSASSGVLCVYSSPNCSEVAQTGRYFEPGAVFSTSARWSPEEAEEDIVQQDQLSGLGTGSGDGDLTSEAGTTKLSANVFLKLAEREGMDGWVAVFHPKTREALLTRIS